LVVLNGLLEPKSNTDLDFSSLLATLPNKTGAAFASAEGAPKEILESDEVTDFSAEAAGSVAPGFKVEQHAHLIMSFLLGA